PRLTRVAFMFNPDTAPYSRFFTPVIEVAATSLGVQLTTAPVRAAADIEAALALFARQPNGGLLLQGDSFTRLHQSLIADLAGRYRLPSIAPGPDFAKQGGHGLRPLWRGRRPGPTSSNLRRSNPEGVEAW